MYEAYWLSFAVYSACKGSFLPQVFDSMRNLKKARLEFTNSQLLSIKNRIKNWSTKDQIIDIMRYRYGRLEDPAI